MEVFLLWLVTTLVVSLIVAWRIGMFRYGIRPERRMPTELRILQRAGENLSKMTPSERAELVRRVFVEQGLDPAKADQLARKFEQDQVSRKLPKGSQSPPDFH